VSSDRVTALVADIQAGPDALDRLLAAYAAVDGPLAGIGDRPGRVVLTGLGSSRYAALTTAALLRSSGMSAWSEYASTDVPTPPAGDLALVAISASGTTREVVAAAARHRGIGRVIAITNDIGSPLAAEADVVLPLLAGTETSGISTRTFRATNAVLGMLTGHWLRGDPGVDALLPTVDALRAAIDARAAWVVEAAERLDGAVAVDVIGPAGDAALVEQAALMLREAPRLPAFAHDTGDWLHTAVYLALPGHRAVIFGGADTDEAVVRTIERRGGQTVVVGGPIPGASQVVEIALPADRIGRVIVGSVVAELLSAELWRRTTAREMVPPEDGLVGS
jgi:glutamine---fructose-6-phosphate transaminase (isomerizing)